ncbi:MAG: DUF922 domain-containing Zn-dependent protease [Syntrophales bacterium]|nr:DUF922 domain-containing Zn-dependent protease [Syntrophales bacterium]
MISFICRSWFLTLLISFAVIIGPISAVHAAPHVSITKKYYSIHGLTAQELRQQLNRNGVKADNGKTHDAFTRWDVKLRYNFRSKGNLCAIRSVKAFADVTYTLPKWSDEARAPQELRNRWRRYLLALKKHEDGHRDIGVSAAAEIEQAVGALGPEASCRDVEIKANTLGKSIMEKFRQSERIYDIRTVHGLTQGAVFP